MKVHRLLIAAAVAVSVFVGTAEAAHVVWLDFSNFNLNAFASVNGNSPPTANDKVAVRRQIVANMAADYAPFDITFTYYRPANGRYTRIRFLDTSGGGFTGCAGPDCCPPGGTCTGIGSWDDMSVSAAEIYAPTIAGWPEFEGANATTSRIAKGLSWTGSHELGHILGLSHCRAADDSFSLGCGSILSTTDDTNTGWHIMAADASWGWSPEAHATRNVFFSVHSSRRVLYENFQARNHWNILANLNAGAGRSDLLYGRIKSLYTVTQYARLSNGASFQAYSTWSNDAGDAYDIFLTGDVNGDDRDDLVYGRIFGPNTVRWYVRLSTGNSFGAASVYINDAGDAGDIFRLADVNGDGRDDLIYGRPVSETQIKWYFRYATGLGYFSPTLCTWSHDAGNEGDIFLVGDVDADGDADLVYGRPISNTQVTWYVRRSYYASTLCYGLDSFETWREDAGDVGDLFYLADVGGDGDADLVYGRIFSDWQVRWYVRGSNGSGFNAHTVWANDAGDAGDLFRLGHGNGSSDTSGRADLFYGRPTGMTSLDTTPVLNTIRWYGRLSLGDSFDGYTTWASDAGDEGDIFP